jgi:hypothetical protein
MTSLTTNTEVLKQDTRGRVRVPAARREALLDEFEKSGTSGAKFAQLAGIKYATFAGWAARRRKERARTVKSALSSSGGLEEVTLSAGTVRLVEAVVEGGAGEVRQRTEVAGLVVELPGGSRMLVGSPLQLHLAAQLVSLIAHSAPARC